MTADLIASLALDYWRASGRRTERRRNELLTFYTESYYGPEQSWPAETVAIRADAEKLARMRTRIDELVYE